MASCSFALVWPMNSVRRRGRSFSSKELSSSPRVAETSRSGSLSPCLTIRSVSTTLNALPAEVLCVGVGRHASRACSLTPCKGLLTSHSPAQSDEKRRMPIWREYLRLKLRILPGQFCGHMLRSVFSNIGVGDDVPDTALAAGWGRIRFAVHPRGCRLDRCSG